MAHACHTSVGPPTDNAPERCPLCGGVNDCQLCTAAAYKGPCWCVAARIPDELLARVPAEARHRACICRECVETHSRLASASTLSSPKGGEGRGEEAQLLSDQIPSPQPSPRSGGERESVAASGAKSFRGELATSESLPQSPEDFYFTPKGLMVFTAAYHLRRGYCCGHDCRHCPYQLEPTNA